MYRETSRSCPACASPMREVELRLRGGGSTGIDLCDSCGGVFLEFFDGEPGTLSRRLLPRCTRRGLTRPPSARSSAAPTAAR